MNLDVLYAFKCLAPVLIWTDVLERVRKASAWLAKIMAEDTIYTYFIGYLSLTQRTDYVMGGLLTEKESLTVWLAKTLTGDTISTYFIGPRPLMPRTTHYVMGGRLTDREIGN